MFFCVCRGCSFMPEYCTASCLRPEVGSMLESAYHSFVITDDYILLEFFDNVFSGALHLFPQSLLLFLCFERCPVNQLCRVCNSLLSLCLPCTAGKCIWGFMEVCVYKCYITWARTYLFKKIVCIPEHDMSRGNSLTGIPSPAGSSGRSLFHHSREALAFTCFFCFSVIPFIAASHINDAAA